MNKTRRRGSKRQSFKHIRVKSHKVIKGGAKRVLDDGGVVEGDIKKGKVIGRGKLTYSNGEVYEGAFNGFTPHGKTANKPGPMDTFVRASS